MGIMHIMKRGGDDLHEYKKALKMAKKGIEWLCDLTEEMEDKYAYEDDEEDEEETKSYRRRSR